MTSAFPFRASRRVARDDRASRSAHASAAARPVTATGVPPVPPEDPPTAESPDAMTALRAGGRIDVRQAVTERIVAMLEQGGHVFRARWVAAASRGFPRNLCTGRPYRGANVLLLWDEALTQGYATPLWMTYRQAQALGGQVRRGEHGVLCAHFERVGQRRDGVGDGGRARGRADGEASDSDAAADALAARSGFLRCRPFWLFNLAQVDGLSEGRGAVVAEASDAAAEASRADAQGSGREGRTAVENALRLVAGCDAVVRHGFERAMYLPALDEIRLPLPGRFVNADNYCATLLHELVHWSGHPSRLHRAFGARFGDAAYAFEELVAELGAAFLMGRCGLVDATIEGHAGYLEAWLAVLRNDRTAIFSAARHASDAFDWIVAQALPEIGELC
ncbi:ArdC family protein [Variovorax sp. RCC_210]|uniref:ArdC family protein n=1 Tax=Variovorax sp. RCC_210 TaxID=3239217 RepID=UPI003524019D